MGSMRNAVPPPTDVVEVSEDSSVEDQDHHQHHHHSIHNFTTNSGPNRTKTRKKRKTRRSSRISKSSLRSASIDRHSVQSNEQSDDDEGGLYGTSALCVNDTNAIARGGVSCPFPWKLHEMLEFCCPENGTLRTANASSPQNEPTIVKWNPEGTAFAVLDSKLFVQSILPRYVCLHS